jgi:tetratricopeptide (TPR) repeat protein
VTESKMLCEELGDSRQWGDSTVLLAESAYLAGEIDVGLSLQKVLLDDARKRNSPLHIGWGLAGGAANSVRLGREADAILMLEEALQILEKIPNRASSINTNAQLALALLKTGDTRKAKLHAAEALRLARGSSPTNYAMLIGFSAAAEVYFTLWDETLRSRDGMFDAADLRTSAEEALALLHSYKNVFPIGQAYFGYFKGWRESLTAKPTAAMNSWSKALEAAGKFHLKYEEGILRVKLAQGLEKDPAAQAKHLARARQLFETMGAARELESVRRLTG